MAVTYKITFQVKPEQVKLFQQLIHGVLDHMSRELEFQHAHLEQSPQNLNTFMLFETWNDHENVIDVQLHRPYRKEWHDALPNLLVADRSIEIWTPVRNVTGDPTQPARPSAVVETNSSTIRLADTTLFYRDWGSGNPVFFVAGWAMPSDMWFYQMLHFSKDGFRTIAYDRRGHGRSSDPGGGYDYDTLADDLASVIEALNLWNVTMVSHSMGAGEIIRYLSKYGSKRIARVVMVAPTTLPCVMKTEVNPDGLDESILLSVAETISTDYPGWIEQNAEPFVTAATSAGMLQWLKGLCLAPSLQALVACQQTNTHEDFRHELKSIDVPTLIIQGDKDASGSLEMTAKQVTELIPGSRLLIYEGAPHGLFVTHMQRLNSDLEQFAHGPTS